MKKISIIIPIYNEEETIPFLQNRIINTIGKIKNYQFNIVLINDGSKDKSLEMIRNCRKIDKRFEYISLSRNYGKEIAMLAGLDYAKDSDAVIIMDADLQDPPELIEKLIKEWEKGYDDVYAKRKSREGETWLKKITSKMYYQILEKISKVPIQKDTGDFRLLDKRCVIAICQMREQSRCSKSLFNWIGYHKKEILFERDKRIAGKTKWNYAKLIQLAIDGITSLSTAPLRWISYTSVTFIFISILYAVILAIGSLTGKIISGNNLFFLGILFLSSIQMIFISIIGEYLGRIFQETKHRPSYLIDQINGKKQTNQAKENKDEQEKNHTTDFSNYHYFTN